MECGVGTKNYTTRI